MIGKVIASAAGADSRGDMSPPRPPKPIGNPRPSAESQDERALVLRGVSLARSYEGLPADAYSIAWSADGSLLAAAGGAMHGVMVPGPWQDLEVEAFLQQFARRNRPIIPVVLESRSGNPRLPGFLSSWHMVDMRKPDPDPFEQLVWGVTGGETRLARQNPRPATEPPVPLRSSCWATDNQAHAEAH